MFLFHFESTIVRLETPICFHLKRATLQNELLKNSNPVRMKKCSGFGLRETKMCLPPPLSAEQTTQTLPNIKNTQHQEISRPIMFQTFPTLRHTETILCRYLYFCE